MKNKIPPENRAENTESKDASIENALSPLRGLKIPPTLRASNEQRIREALAERAERSERTGFWWWRRRISIPAPVAAGFLIAFCLLSLFQLVRIFQPTQATKPSEYKADKAVIPSDTKTIAPKQKQPSYYEKTVYIAGMGFINQERGYQFLQENNYENN